MYNYIYFVSKPEIGLHILSYLKPENLEKPTKSTKNNIPELFWEGPQLQSQKNIGKTKKNKRKQYSGTLWEGPHIQKSTPILFSFFLLFFFGFSKFFFGFARFRSGWATALPNSICWSSLAPLCFLAMSCLPCACAAAKPKYYPSGWEYLVQISDFKTNILSPSHPCLDSSLPPSSHFISC